MTLTTLRQPSPTQRADLAPKRAAQVKPHWPADAPASVRWLVPLLQRLQIGSLSIRWPDGSHALFGHPEQVQQPHGELHLNNWSVCSAAIKSGDIGFAESYIAGDWQSPDLTALLKVLVANRDQVESLIYGTWLGRLSYRIRHLLNHNSKRNSRKNIHAHYDLGNGFYQRWLDATMNYSSAWFEGDHSQSLSRAQNAKVRRALTEVGVMGGPADQRVLEIGCGWGALAEMATLDAQAQVTGVTLSTEQLGWAQRRLKAAGQWHRADLRLQDYRDIQDEPFDAIVSIEMFEAVGQSYWPTYFKTVSRLLKPGGKACIQTITIRDDLFDRYSRSTDFIQQYIFPGGMLPSDAQFRQHAEKAGLKVVAAMPFGPDYAETLRRWRDAYEAQAPALRSLGFDERFERIWRFYLCYCEAAFDTGNTNVVQYTLHKA